MFMTPQIDKAELECLKYLGNSQTVVEAQLTARDAETVKILALNADANVTSSECLAGEVLYGGKLTVKALIRDGDDNVAGLNYNVDFNNKFCNAEISPDVKLNFFPVVVDISGKVSGNVIKVKCVVETKIYACVKNEVDLLSSCDELMLKTDVIDTAVRKCTLDKTFSVVDEVELKEKIGKILSADSKAVLSSVSAKGGVVTANGNLYTCVTYLTGEKDVIRSSIVNTSFEEEFSADCDDKSVITAFAEAKNVKIHMEISEDGDNRGFTLSCDVNVKIKCSEIVSRDIVTDAFSFTHNIEKKTTTFDNCVPQNYFMFTYKADGIIELENKNDVDEILCVTNPRVISVGSKVNGGYVSAEGILSGTLLFLNDGRVDSAEFEVPFVFDIPCVCQNCIIWDGAVCEISAKVIRGEVNVDAKVKFGVNCQDVTSVCAVSDVVMLDEKQNCGCAIEVVTGKKGMSSWDLQKFLSAPESEILSCNEGLSFPLEKDRKILIYRQIKN